MTVTQHFVQLFQRKSCLLYFAAVKTFILKQLQEVLSLYKQHTSIKTLLWQWIKEAFLVTSAETNLNLSFTSWYRDVWINLSVHCVCYVFYWLGLICLYPVRVCVERETSGTRSPEEHLSSAAGGRPSLLQTHGPRRGEHHPQLPGQHAVHTYNFTTVASTFTTLTVFSDRTDWSCGRHLQKHVVGRWVYRLRRSDPTGEEHDGTGSWNTQTHLDYARHWNVELRVSCQIIIEKSPTPVAPGKSHFNMRGSPVEGRDVWDVKKLLEVTRDRWTSFKMAGAVNLILKQLNFQTRLIII